jgi:hypothetical protein
MLLLSQLFDYKLYFDKLNPLIKVAYFYKISSLELGKIREYLIKNLKKDFIKLFDSLFLLLILFIKKKDNSLCFYINYY